ncbi:MAG TPA: zinc ABC transporter substrate-binding protein [Gaiellaceae bacterium]
MRTLVALVALSALAVPLGNTSAAAATPRLQVVAAENFWGSLAAQLGGDRVETQSIVGNPATDPHDYEPVASDARAMAGSQLAIVTGIGYDTWASRLLAANPSSTRVVIDTGDLLGLSAGDNPHQWYSPRSVRAVAAAITAGLERLDPTHRPYFAARARQFATVALARYNALRGEIRRRFAGVPVGYSESIFEPLGTSLGLRLSTPSSFASSVAEGADVSAKDIQAVDRQAQERLIDVWVFNSQNLTPEVQRVNEIARSRHIPIVTITETLSPAGATFEQWQVAQLERLLAALHRATGR